MREPANLPLTSIENDLESILPQLDSQVWSVEKLFHALKGKGYPFLVVLLSLPFCQPIQIPGFSTPFGIALIFVGLRMVFGKGAWWPQWILRKEISSKFLKTVVQSSLKFFKFLRPLLQPRLTWVCKNGFYYVHGVFIVILGGFLALPLPIPFSNLFAAWALFCLGLGIIEQDGIFVCLGYLLGLTGLFLLGFIIDLTHALIKYWFQ